MNDIKGLDVFDSEVKDWNGYSGDLRIRAGAGLINALESWYAQWKAKPDSKRALKEYRTWRVRLHRRWNGNKEFLEELNTAFELGLYDEGPGPLMWDIGYDQPTGFKEFNWRRDSGDALRGRRRSVRSVPLEEVDEIDTE